MGAVNSFNIRLEAKDILNVLKLFSSIDIGHVYI